jgi:hypothetical protein
MDLVLDKTFNITVNKEIKQIKSAMSYNHNFFVCCSLNKTPSCYINSYSKLEFTEIGCKFDTEYDPAYKILYFNETDDFFLISRYDLTTTRISNFNNSIKLCRQPFLTKQSNVHGIIYFNDYKVVNYSNFSNYMKCNNISIKEEEFKITSIPYIPKYTTNIINMIGPTYIIDTTQNGNLNKISDFIFVNNNTYFLNPNYISSYNIIPKTNIAIISNSTYIKEITTKTKEEIFNNIENVLTDKQVGVNYEIKGEDFTIIIKPTNSTPLPNTTHVEFDECEKIIRKDYNISNSSIITFLQIEMENNDKSSLYNQIKYFIYDDNMQELDLSLCSELNTHIHYAIKNNSKLDISSISEFKENGIDLLNIKDRFFNDLCYSYSDSDNDMILEDRIKYLYQNYSLCESGCTYDYLDIENMNIACNCKIQGNDNTSSFNQTSFIFQQPRETSFFDSNIGVVKCYNLVFSLYNKANNIGFIAFSILFFIYLIFIICFCRNGIKPVREYLSKEMKLNGYLNKDNNKLIDKGKKNKKKLDIVKKKRKNKSITNLNKIQKSI